MTVSTCAPPLSQHFEIIDTVFAMDSRGQAGFLVNEEADPHGAFAGVKQKLKDIAFHLGADAVVNCQFEYRVAVSTDKLTAAVGAAVGVGIGHAQTIEIFAYGTAIKFTSPDTNVLAENQATN